MINHHKKLRNKKADNEFTKALLCAIFDVRKHIAKLLWTRRFSIVKMMTIDIIGMYEGISMKDLAERIGISVPSTSVMVQDLVDKGMVKRQLEENDRRKVRILLTPKGKRIMEQTMTTMTKTLFDPISDVDKQAYLRILKRIGLRETK